MSGAIPTLGAADLLAAGRSPPGEFRCPLRSPADLAWPGGLAGSPEVSAHCRQVFRLLPGRRLTALADVAGRTVLLKLFLGAEAGRYRDREARGCALLDAAGVSTPALLGAVSAADGAGEGLLFEYLPDAQPLRHDDAEGMRAAVAALALLHRRGATHRDPHLDNFIRRSGDGRVFLIDGDGVRPTRARRPLGRLASLNNLARLCAERAPLADDHLGDLLGSYAAARGWGESGSGEAAVRTLRRATRRQRRARVRRYLRKAQRDCTEFACERGRRHFRIGVRGAQGAAIAGVLADPESAMRGAEVVKAGNSATVVRVRLPGGGACIVKRYNRKNWRQALRRALKPVARFRLAWLNGQRLHLLGIPTARPLALLERRYGPLRGVAYLVMEDRGALDLHRLAAAGRISDALIAATVALFRALRAAELRHRDTKASNFVVDGDDVVLVDLDAMGPMRSGGNQADVRRFLASFDRQPALRQRFAAAFEAAGLMPPAAPAGRVAAGPRRL